MVRGKIMDLEYNKSGKIQELRAEDEAKGIVKAYLTKWNSVDSYGSAFEKGSFTKSFQSRGAEGIRLIYNHDHDNGLAGKITEVGEDTYGPFAVCQFNLDTEVGKTAFAHVRAGDIKAFSFGFNVVKESTVGSIRKIEEVDIRECGPVVFEANSRAKVTSVRKDQKKEKRSTDFDQTQAEKELRSKGWQLFTSLEQTIDEIYYTGDSSPAEIIEQVDIAIAKFHTAYISWLNEYYTFYEARGESVPNMEIRNELSKLMKDVDTDELIKRTEFTEDEVKTLKKGKILPIESRSKLREISEEVLMAHQKHRSIFIEGLCDEIRSGGLTDGEVDRIMALLENSRPFNLIENTVSLLKDIQNNF